MAVKFKWDSMYTGLGLGVILPVASFIVTWVIRSDQSLVEYIRGFQRLQTLSGLVSLSVIPNLLLFFVFIWLAKYRASRGVIFATLVFAILMLILKLI